MNGFEQTDIIEHIDIILLGHDDRPALSSALLGEARSLSSAILSRLYVTHFSRVLPLGHAKTRARMCIAPDVLGCPDFAGILLHVSRRSQADTSVFGKIEFSDR